MCLHCCWCSVASQSTSLCLAFSSSRRLKEPSGACGLGKPEDKLCTDTSNGVSCNNHSQCYLFRKDHPYFQHIATKALVILCINTQLFLLKQYNRFRIYSRIPQITTQGFQSISFLNSKVMYAHSGKNKIHNIGVILEAQLDILVKHISFFYITEMILYRESHFAFFT